MRWSLPLLLLAALGAGCLGEARDVAPVVLVVSSYEITGEGRTSHILQAPCEGATYSLDPPEVRLHRAPPEGMRPTFVLVQDLGDPWRVADRSAEEGARVLAQVSSAGGGPFWWLGRDRTVSLLGFSSAFPEGARGSRTVTWDGDRAEHDGRTLREGAPVARTFEYDVATDEGGALHVRETLRVTYLGKVPVSLDGPVCR